jgi:iron complex outermembrane receptor protein
MSPAGFRPECGANPELHFSEVTSVGPNVTSQFDSFQATNVLGGQDLTQALQSTLGATLENEPGIALRSLGPGSARPVVRGLDGDRVLIVEDGLRMGDRPPSGDHGVNANPARFDDEVVRGRPHYSTAPTPSAVWSM